MIGIDGVIQFLKEAPEREAQQRRAKVNAKCPHCGEDLFDELQSTADQSGYATPESVCIACPECEAELSFRLYWESHICAADLEEDPWQPDGHEGGG